MTKFTRADRLFSCDSPKAIKADKFGFINAILYIAPHTLGGVGNLCSHASPGCIALCLGHYSGQASMVSDLERDDNQVRRSRREKAQRFMRDRAAFVADVVHSIESLEYKAGSLGKKLCVRMNGATDIAWEGIPVLRGSKRFANIFEAFPQLPFVDYTKNPRRFDRKLPANYHLTFSRSETNARDAMDLLSRGVNVAVVFGGDKPAEFYGRPVVDGDQHDLRHLDPRGAEGFVIGLSPKGRKAKADRTGFVVR
ncbi:MAG TPA: hypothetical protein VHT52_20775 [Stellaceae bacterium]|nr:hypothetical protein [Stellaceae bacterium]